MKYTLQPARHYRPSIRGTSDALYLAAWRQYRRYLVVGSIDDPTSDEDVISWLEQIIREKVNDSRSRFYITG